MDTSEVFHIVPASSRSAAAWFPIVGVLLLVTVGAIALITVSIRASRAATFELSVTGLRLRGDLYGREVPASQLRGGATRIVNLDEDRALRSRRRTMGTALPGYRAAWFRLANGDKALLYVTDPRRVVCIPTRAGYSVLLSVDPPTVFVDRIRAIAPAT